MQEVVRYRLKLVREKAIQVENATYELYSASRVVKLCEQLTELSTATEEVCILICLDIKSMVAGVFEVSRGDLSSSIIHPREVLKRALLCNAHSMILLHNHPSGDTTPSTGDLKVTAKLVDAGEAVGVNLVDHIIVGDLGSNKKAFLSMKQKGLIIRGRPLKEGQDEKAKPKNTASQCQATKN